MGNAFLKSTHNVKTISLKLLLSLFPLILTGFYKNGLKLYLNDLVNFYGLIKPLVFVLTGFLIGAFINIVEGYFIRKSKSKFWDIAFSSFHPVYGVIVASVISINTKLWLFAIIILIVFIISKLSKDAKFNAMAVSALIIIFIINLTGEFTFLNIYESNTTLQLNTLDYLIGRGSGGINTSFVLWLLYSLFYLMKEDYYKKSIALYSGIVFSILMAGYCIYTNQIGLILENIFANGILFCFIYVATDSLSSSYTKRGQVTFGIMIGILSFCFFLIEPTLAALGAILIVSLLHKAIDWICLKSLKN